mmetsp:Transcript_16041/g.17836  ORF Transcript_16041/g.17836 Transcript_16041/m.17836 type:complete len:388 (+) Transcript_16041:76-1239(+)
MNLHSLFLLLSAVVTRANTAHYYVTIVVGVASSLSALSVTAAVDPTDDDIAEAACIMNSLDWENSVAAKVLNRGFPLFAPDQGVDISGLPDGRVSQAVLELEPIFEVDVDALETYLEKSEDLDLRNAYTVRSSSSERGSGGNDFSSTDNFGARIGLSLYEGLRTIGDIAFSHIGDGYRYFQDVCRFATEKGNPMYTVRSNSGPLILKNPYDNPQFLSSYPNGVRLTQAYVAAIDALPEVFESESYLNFGKRFGYGKVYSILFASTEYTIGVSNSTYMTLGSSHYNGSECVNPDFSKISYTLDIGNIFPLNNSQRMKFNNYKDNIVNLIRLSPESPIGSTECSIVAPTMNPTKAPTTNQTKAPTESVAVTLTTRSSWFIVVLVALFFN